jgi:hypothetical protein
MANPELISKDPKSSHEFALDLGSLVKKDIILRLIEAPKPADYTNLLSDMGSWSHTPSANNDWADYSFWRRLNIPH